MTPKNLSAARLQVLVAVKHVVKAYKKCIAYTGYDSSRRRDLDRDLNQTLNPLMTAADELEEMTETARLKTAALAEAARTKTRKAKI